MWHWPHVRGNRASATDVSCLAWHFVQLPIDPSALGAPMEWQLSQPTVIAVSPSSTASVFGGRFTAPGWYRSAKSTCSSVKGAAPWIAANAGAGCRLRRN